MKNQAFNPYLPSWEYIPDGEPYVFGDRLYVYGSHDCFDSDRFCANNYVCWSAPVDDLSDWRNEGYIYSKEQDPLNHDSNQCLYAPDVQVGPDGRYYLYYALNCTDFMSVAVCDTPAGKYEFYGHIKYPDGHIIGTRPGEIRQFDPGVFMDDDGRVFLFTGFAPSPKRLEFANGLYRVDGGYLIELEQDMMTVKRGPERIFRRPTEADGTSFEGHEFFEASSLRKINGRYYFIYSSANGHELCYATSDRPDGGYEYGGTIISNGDVYLNGRTLEDALNYTGNTHGSIVEVNGQWYVFYHRQTNMHQYSRQACAERIYFEEDGSIKQVEMTSCGLNGGPLQGEGEYEARIACVLRSKEGAYFYPLAKDPAGPGIHPYFTQSGVDREDNGDQYIANFRDGSVAGYKYFSFRGCKKISVRVRGNAGGSVLVSTEMGGKPSAVINITPSADWSEFTAPISITDGIQPLYFTFTGEGAFDFTAFRLG